MKSYSDGLYSYTRWRPSVIGRHSITYNAITDKGCLIDFDLMLTNNKVPWGMKSHEWNGIRVL